MDWNSLNCSGNNYYSILRLICKSECFNSVNIFNNDYLLAFPNFFFITTAGVNAMNDNIISIDWVNSASDISDILWSICFPPPLEGKWWYESLEKAGLEDQFVFSYGILRDGGSEVGIIPVFAMDVPIDLVVPEILAKIISKSGRLLNFLKYQKTLFLGSPCSDEGTVGLVPGISIGEIAPFIQDALIKKAIETKNNVIVWKDFPESTAKELECLRYSHKVFRMVSFPGTVMPLAPGGFDGHLMTLNGDKRSKLRRKLKKSRSCGELIEEVIQYPDDVTLNEIFGLFWQTYLNGKTKFEKLTIQFFKNIARCERSHFVLLRHAGDGKLAAFMLCFLFEKRVINKFIGLDYTLTGNWFLYFRLNEAAIRWASGTGVSEFQSGQTGYHAKVDLGHKLVPQYNFCFHRNPLVNFVFKTIGTRSTWSDLDSDLKLYSKAD